MTRREILKSLALLAAFAASPALAAGQALPPPLSDEDTELVQRAAAYLDGLGQIKGRFVQTDPRGGTSQGVLYLNRPGKARFEYEGPAQRLVVSDGHTVVVYDGRLKTFNRYPLGSTPLALFLQRHVRLDQKVVVTRVDHGPGGFMITARDGRHESQGEITLAFSDGPMALKEWSILDARGARTTVRLSDLEPVSGLDPALFQLQNPARASP
jgi:outer membrane lipoprotein-sorting protein